VTPPTADDRSEGWHGASMTRADLHRLVDELSEEAVARLHRGNAITLAVVRDEGHLIMHEIDPEQAWFWTPEWRAKEREADEDLTAGRFTRYESDEKFLAALDAQMKPSDADT
jgi:hypothetical protein